MAASVTTPDAKGRKLTIRELSVVDQFRLARVLGKAGDSDKYSTMAQAACMVSEIDGVPLPFPTTERQLEVAVERLGDEGFAAVLLHLRRLNEAAISAAEQAANRGEVSGPLERSAA